MVILNRVCFSQVYISRLDRISARSTWESIQSSSATLKFVYLPSQLFRKLVYAEQDLDGDSWEGMLSVFRNLVSNLYRQWEDCLVQSLKLPERTYFQSIRNRTATEPDLRRSLYNLSRFLAEKFSQRVIVLIDEYEVPINRAYDRYFNNVCSLYLSMTIWVKDKYSRPTSFSGMAYFLFS
jgi:hypothetical protein